MTYEYWFSEDAGRTWRMVGLIGSDARQHIESVPTTGKFRRRFVLA